VDARAVAEGRADAVEGSGTGFDDGENRGIAKAERSTTSFRQALQGVALGFVAEAKVTSFMRLAPGLA